MAFWLKKKQNKTTHFQVNIIISYQWIKELTSMLFFSTNHTFIFLISLSLPLCKNKSNWKEHSFCFDIILYIYLLNFLFLNFLFYFYFCGLGWVMGLGCHCNLHKIVVRSSSNFSLEIKYWQSSKHRNMIIRKLRRFCIRNLHGNFMWDI